MISNHFLTLLFVLTTVSTSLKAEDNWLEMPEERMEGESNDTWLMTSPLEVADPFSPDSSDSQNAESGHNGQGQGQAEPDWADDIHYALAHTQARSSGGQIDLQRWSTYLDFERSLSERWYLNLEAKAVWLQSNDQQAEQKGHSFIDGDLTRGWLQYSRQSCSLMMGKQTLVWGSVDGTFALDQITPLDLTEPLLTDYSRVRLGQWMAVANCYSGEHQWQGFINLDPQLSRYRYGDSGYSDSGLENEENLGFEWGGRYRRTLTGKEVSFMAAHLISNDPQWALGNEGLTVDEYTLIGASVTAAMEEWLLNTDISWRDQQSLTNSKKKTETLDVAVGIEYTSPSNHTLNVGVWGSWDQSSASNRSQTPTLTAGWNKSYWHDALAMSLLLRKIPQPDELVVTLLGEYDVNDLWTVSLAYTGTDTNQSDPTSSDIPPTHQWLMQVKAEF